MTIHAGTKFILSTTDFIWEVTMSFTTHNKDSSYLCYSKMQINLRIIIKYYFSSIGLRIF